MSRTRPPAELSAALEHVSIVSVCEENPMRNVGDHWSSVGRTVGWVREHAAIVSLPEAAMLGELGARSPLQGKLLVVGGSGLVGPGQFEHAVESLPRQRPAGIVLWGIGHNVQAGVHNDPTTGWRKRVLRADESIRLWPQWFADAALVGVRDYDAGMPWVPCASSMLPVFDELRAREPDLDFVVLNHYERGIDTSQAIAAGARFAHLNNNTEDLRHVLETLTRAPAVVTNSYHAAYWGLLLGRSVVLVAPNSTRFRGFRWPVAFAGADDWLEHVGSVPASPDALSEARAANVAYSGEVASLARSLGLLPASARIDAAAGAPID